MIPKSTSTPTPKTICPNCTVSVPMPPTLAQFPPPVYRRPINPFLQAGIGASIGVTLGWLTSRWRHRDARRQRRSEEQLLRDAEATVARAGPILQREIARLEAERDRLERLHDREPPVH